MTGFAIKEKKGLGISDDELRAAVRRSLGDIERGGAQLRKVLLVVPDFTRFHSNGGLIANFYYHLLKDRCQVDLLVALGTHVAMTECELRDMYGDIPFERFVMHDWRSGVRKLGVVPGEFVSQVSDGLIDTPVDVEVNKILWDGYDHVFSIGQVVPHEVVGMANHSKNIFVGCGGASMINASHMLGAYYGMERIMGRDFSPVRKVFDYAEQKYLGDFPLTYVLTVTSAPDGAIHTHGLYVGRERSWFEQAVAHSQQMNLTFMDRLPSKVVVYLDEGEFKSTWLGNKSIYRTRMMIADGGSLFVLAPGVHGFGEDKVIDGLIRKYGYMGRENTIRACEANEDLQDNLSAAAHLIHGSSDGRFSVTYCTQFLSEQEVLGVGYDYMPFSEAVSVFDPAKLVDGWNTLDDGEEIFYISNPALGLWVDKKKF